jgi:hypothetical protein
MIYQGGKNLFEFGVGLGLLADAFLYPVAMPNRSEPNTQGRQRFVRDSDLSRCQGGLQSSAGRCHSSLFLVPRLRWSE